MFKDNRSRSSSFSDSDRHPRRVASNSRGQRRDPSRQEHDALHTFGAPYKKQQGNGGDGAVIVSQFQDAEGVQGQSVQSFHVGVRNAEPRVESQSKRARDEAARRYDSRAANVPATAANFQPSPVIHNA